MIKKLFLSTLGLLLICMASIAQTKIVERPQFVTANTDAFEISKLELKDSETVLYCDGYGKPNDRISLSSKSYLKSESGKIYKFIRSEGFEMDKEMLIPISGTVSFKLYMESLDKNETSFDFMEGENSDQFQILGIKTYIVKSNAPIHCLIKGEVIGRPQSSRLRLIRQGDGQPSSGIYIPIHKGKFEYELNCYNQEAYELNFYKEYSQSLTFFSEQDTVFCKLFPEDQYYKDIAEGGVLNRKYNQYKATKDSLFQINATLEKIGKLIRENKYVSAKYISLDRQIKESKNQNIKDSIQIIFSNMKEDEFLSPETIALEKERQKKQDQASIWNLKYIREHVSIVSYSLLVKKTSEAVSELKENIPECSELYYSVYANKYPNHPYTEQMKNKLKGLSVKVGSSYVDFTAPDFTGKSIRLSEQVKGKVALIDLWASWCLPCRRTSKSMIPLYEAYKDKGFTIVGIARENELAIGIAAAKKDKYPWLNLIELKDKGRIWEKYNIQKVAGGTFLVDKNGIILAIDPTDVEVKTILDKLLN